ncbi:MAG: SDR family NAD(P)-dependent oxidoreductase [Hymenobacter sp.]
MKQALITGANRSIGLETARQLLRAGYYVYLGNRDLQKGQQAVAQLHAEGLTQVEPVSHRRGRHRLRKSGPRGGRPEDRRARRAD